jgi:hypothetical protein
MEQTCRAGGGRFLIPCQLAGLLIFPPPLTFEAEEEYGYTMSHV